MGANQLFTVYGFYGNNNIVENYTIKIYNSDMTTSAGPWSGDDDSNQGFTTPSFPTGSTWRYYEITGTSGQVYFENTDDTIYGPEINTVGW
jgi:hypothetical protein